ncbi:MAG: alpha/beta fold hydrolase [bacterium]
MPRLSANGINVNYRLEGSGEVVVLIHGFTAELGMWEHQVEALRKRYQVLAYDLRGHGDTDHPVHGHDMQTLSRDLEALLDRLDIKIAHLAGVSLGGMIAQRFCLDHEQRTATLSLMDTFAGRVSQNLQKRLFRHARLGKEKGIEALFEHLLEHPALPVGPDLEVSMETLEKRKQAFLKNDPHTLEKFVHMLSRQEDWTGELERIKKPVLLIVGDQDEPSLDHMRSMHRMMPGSEFYVIERCGHSCVTEKPEEVSSRLISFLERNPVSATSR